MLHYTGSIQGSKKPVLLTFPCSDFQRLLICYRGHVPGPKGVKKPSVAISNRLTPFRR